MSCYIFAYGTLKKGLKYHDLLKSSKFLGFAKTLEKYSLFYGEYPYLVDIPFSHIQGEVYEIAYETLKKIDFIESVEDVYYKKEIPVKLYNGKIIDAITYFYPFKRGWLIVNGKFL